MFNFKLMNRALKDAELKDAFRMLYYIVNKCSLKNSMSVEIFDAEFELALSISPRSTCRFTKKLEERGYIKKEVRGTSQNKLANIYTLIDVEVNNTPTDSLCNDINKDAQKFPLTDDANIDGSSDGSSDGRIGILKNNIKINKKYNIFLSNSIDLYTGTNMNTGNNKIEDINNINLNKENEMNEERMNEMNDINNSTLEERLGTQPLDDDTTNTTGNFKNTGSKYSQEEQDRYHRLFDNCKSQIEIWTKTHEYKCISMFDSFYKVIQYMHQSKTISDKQWEASQRYLLQRFMNLRKGYFNYIQKKNKTISSMEFNECKNPQPPQQQNDQMEEAV